MTCSICRAAGIALLTLALVSARSASAQANPDPTPSSPPPEGGEFFASIDVSVVNVDVFVTDKKGNRIRGLGRDDFELFEGGKPVAISNFYAVEEGSPVKLVEPVAASATGAGPTVPAESARPAPPRSAEETPEDQRLYLVVYIDNWNIQPFHRNLVFRQLRSFLINKLSPSDRVMLMTYDREPHVRRPFTSDPATVASALFEIEKLSANGSRLASERREVLDFINESEEASQAYSRVRSYAESLHNDLSFSIDSIRDLVGSLSGLPGRKAILYVSDGLEMVPGEDLFHALSEKHRDSSHNILEARTLDLSRRFVELTAAANASRVSFYTLDAAGLRMSTGISAEVRDPGTSSSLVDSVYWGNLQSSIQLMADRTGGVAIVNTNDPTKGLDVIASDFRNYYSLGYAPVHAGDGRYHKVDVKTKRKDLIVRHRDGFRDKPISARMSDGVVAALNFEVESNPLGIVIDRGEETPRDDGHYLVAISVRIPIGNVVLVPQGENHVARLRLFFAALDEKGGRSEVQEAPVPISVPAAEIAEAAKRTWRYDVPLLMRRGAQRLAVGLRDEIGQVSSFTVKTIRVGG